MSRKFVYICILLFPLVASAAAKTEAEIKSVFKDKMQHLHEFYLDLHMHPELSGQERRTAGRVAEELRALGYQVIEHIGGTGLAAILKNGEGPTTLMRSELDALPVTEDTGADFKSQTPGVMHACGHDLHMTSLVGTAYALTKLKEFWHGTVIFIAQPAEETVEGARAMIKDGLFKKIPKPDTLLALHVTGLYPQGIVAYSVGDALANVDSIEVTFVGRGTHGSTAYKGVDPFVMSAEFTLSLQTLIGREVDPLQHAVISVGSIHGGTKSNIIPDEVKMQLTVRSYDADVRKLLLKRITEIAEGISKTNKGSKPIISHPEESIAVYNDVKLASRLGEAFTQVLGKDRVEIVRPVMGSEDFSYYAQEIKVPSLFFWIGTQTQKENPPINHSPRYLPAFTPTAETSIVAMTSAVLDLNGSKVRAY
jgi:amidohydrolase